MVLWPRRRQTQSCTSGAGTGRQGFKSLPSSPLMIPTQSQAKCCPGSRGWGTGPLLGSQCVRASKPSWESGLFLSLLFLFPSFSVVPPEIGAPRVTSHPGLPGTRVPNQYVDFHCYDQGSPGQTGVRWSPQAPPPEFSLSVNGVTRCPSLPSTRQFKPEAWVTLVAKPMMPVTSYLGERLPCRSRSPAPVAPVVSNKSLEAHALQAPEGLM